MKLGLVYICVDVRCDCDIDICVVNSNHKVGFLGKSETCEVVSYLVQT